MVRIFIFGNILLIVGCSPNQRDCPILSDEYNVISTVIDSVYNKSYHKRSNIKHAVILDSTIKYRSIDGYDNNRITFDVYHKQYSQFDLKVLESGFRSANRFRYALSGDSLHTRLQCDVIPKDSVGAYFKIRDQDGWLLFRKAFPNANGFITFSRVGFNDNKREAMIYYEHNIDWVNAEGGFALLKKVRGEWILYQRIIIWVS